jgi:hypothetical protein
MSDLWLSTLSERPMRSHTNWRAVRAPVATATLIAGMLTGACSDQMPTAPRLAPGERLADRATPTYVFTTIDIPNARSTSAQGINAGGDVSGFYVDLAGRTHGFLWVDGATTIIDYPNADNTDVRGIGPDGSLVGTHWNVGEEAVAFHGYKRTPDGQFSPIHFPGHLYEIPQRILPDGTILGCRHDHDLMATMRGITITPSGASEIDAFASMNNGATSSGHRTVGLYLNMMANRNEAYVIEDGAFSSFVFPGSASTSGWDVNPRGDIVGVYVNGSGAHGWIRSGEGDEFTSIDVNGATATRVFAVNARGDVVGAYVAGGKTHGFAGRRTH